MKVEKFIIAFEGVRGTGKSVQCEKLYSYLNKQRLVRILDCFSIIPIEEIEKELKHIKDKLEKKELYKKYIRSVQFYHMSHKFLEEIYKNERHEIIIIDKYKYMSSAIFRSLDVNNNVIYALSDCLPEHDILFFFKIDPDKAARIVKMRDKKPSGTKYAGKDEIENLANFYEREFTTKNITPFSIDACLREDYNHTIILEETIKKYNQKFKDHPIF